MAEQSYSFVIEEETVISYHRSLTAKSNRSEITCSLASQGCQGVDTTYWWGVTKEPCMYKHVATAVGNWDAAGRLFVGKKPAMTFNISGAPLVNLPTECSRAGEALQETKYRDLFLHRGNVLWA